MPHAGSRRRSLVLEIPVLAPVLLLLLVTDEGARPWPSLAAPNRVLRAPRFRPCRAPDGDRSRRGRVT